MSESELNGSETESRTLEVDDLPIAKRTRPLLTEEALRQFKEEKNRTGVVYISRIPPAMTPATLRQYLAPFGTLGRVYLAPNAKAEAAAKKLSKQARQSSRQTANFVDGWVEFLKRRDAKTAVEVLNGRPYGGRRGSRFREELWCIRYLGRDFTWASLSERSAYENAVREQRMREEVSQARRENRAFLHQVERARVGEKIAQKRQAQAEARGTELPQKPAVSLADIKRRFHQRKPVDFAPNQ